MKNANDRLRIAAFALEIAAFMNAARSGSIVGRLQRRFYAFQHVFPDHLVALRCSGAKQKPQNTDIRRIFCDSVAFFCVSVYNKKG